MNPLPSIAQFAHMLQNLDAWIGKAEAHAKARGFDPEVLLDARLAPDQYPLTRQIQSACDAAKFAGAYLSGTKGPVHPDTEKSLGELHARLTACAAYLRTFKEADFAGAAERRVAPPWMGGNWVRGDQYLVAIAIPNFYFHVMTAYSILRHNGVDLGKMDYIGTGSFEMHGA